ncbi:MAG TPA: Holliday junction resolvase RuvX [Sphingomonas sp.]|nr:Holliday junction resolvase RuvX [Sphingomonas sp.]
MIGTDIAAFAAELPSGGRLAGLDVGTKTIGIAMCDAMWTIASPAETIRRAKFSVDRALLRAFIAKHQVKGLVIGLPLNLDGSDSPRTQSVRAFARNLADLDLPILLWDERWSTQAVTRTLIAADTSRARRAELIDKIAAAYILQGAIDALASGHV